MQRPWWWVPLVQFMGGEEMTDDLIKRLQKYKKRPATDEYLLRETIATLEAQGKRIAELEDKNQGALELAADENGRAEKAETRLAELETKLANVHAAWMQDLDRASHAVRDRADALERAEKAEAERDQFLSIVALAHDWAFSDGTRVLRDPQELSLFDDVTMLGEDNRPHQWKEGRWPEKKGKTND